jgi:hypothetical protein
MKRQLVGALLVFAVAVRAVPGAAVCSGDCDGNGNVTVGELISGVNIALGHADVAVCRACDSDDSGDVKVGELVAAVNSALHGCPVATTPTATPPSPTATISATAPTATETPTAPVLNCEVDGVICTIAGTGRAEFGEDNLPALETSLYFPIDITFDRNGRTLVMDYNNLVLRRFNDDGTLTIVMGIPFIEDYPTEGALAIDTPLHHASDFEPDAMGRMYIAGDHVPVVFRVDTDDRVHTVAGTQTIGNSGDGGPALEAELGVPFGVEPDDAGGFYISDADAHVVRYVNPQGIISTVAGVTQTDGTPFPGYSGNGGLGTAAQINGPGHLQIGPDKALYFVETKNHVVRRLGSDGIISTFAGSGARGYAGDGHPAVEATLDSPRDLRFAPNGDLYIADANNHVIRRVDSNGIITTVVGNGDGTFGGDGGPALQASLFRPSGVNFDTAGSMLIADYSNHRVRRVWHFLR